MKTESIRLNKKMENMTLGVLGCLLFLFACGAKDTTSSNVSNQSNSLELLVPTDSTGWNKLTKEEARVIVYKGTEYPGTGEYVDNHKKGIYNCKRCNVALFDSESKFDSGTGWPSFDSFIGESVEVVLDTDGFREEIVCRNCKGHLGHVFYNEGFTKKQTRHCVNSISLKFVQG
jgi:methionine-R-sulfoxide reductase